MAAAQLVREPVVVGDSGERCVFTDLAGEAAREFREAMADLGIKPFVPAGVDRYKRKLARRLTPLATRVFNMVVIAWVVVTLVAVVVALLGVCGGLVLYLAGSVVAPWWFLVSALAVFLFVCWVFGGGWCLGRIESGGEFLAARWVDISMRRYEGTIPGLVLQTVQVLKERKCPGIEFLVEVLQLEGVRLDPFLVVVDPTGRRYYLEVWSEPGFRQERRV